MIFLSAQPDTSYFIWQLDVQLFNFNKLGIKPQQIHVLIGYNEEKGLEPKFHDFILNNSGRASFFTYTDKRATRYYASSIRPNIIKQHFSRFPELSSQPVFYHDADILFTDKLPDFEKMLSDDTWYLSDARSYLCSAYLTARGPNVLKDMCEIVGISPELVITNDDNAGGAQTLIKNTDAAFWDKVEKDCEKLYRHLQVNQQRYEEEYKKETGKHNEPYHPVSAWCSDMWALLWNGILQAKVEIIPELDFCWPHYPVEDWDKMKIFHNAGVTGNEVEKYFYKQNYVSRDPYEDDFEFVSPKCCSYKYVQYISAVAKNKKYELQDVTFFITTRIDSKDRLENVTTIMQFLTENYNTNITLLEVDTQQKIPYECIPEHVKYIFLFDDHPILNVQKYHNWLMANSTTEIVVRYDTDVIIPPSQINSAIISIRSKESDVGYPFDGRFLHVDGVLRSYFRRTLNIKMLSRYVAEVQTSGAFLSYGGCIVFNRSAFIEMGMENENFNGWGFEDQEIHKRSTILGYKIKRQNGPLYHLFHERGANSYFSDEKEILNSYQEYIRVCNMTRDELINYVRNNKVAI